MKYALNFINNISDGIFLIQDIFSTISDYTSPPKIIQKIWLTISKYIGRPQILFLVAVLEIAVTLILWFWFKEETRRILEIPKYYKFTPIIPGIVAAPYAYCIWYWRDRNKIDDIEHNKKVIENEKRTIQQTDFHQVQVWASGTESNQTLQIAAIYQLRDYINGENGKTFKPLCANVSETTSS